MAVQPICTTISRKSHATTFSIVWSHYSCDTILLEFPFYFRNRLWLVQHSNLFQCLSQAILNFPIYQRRYVHKIIGGGRLFFGGGGGGGGEKKEEDEEGNRLMFMWCSPYFIV